MLVPRGSNERRSLCWLLLLVLWLVPASPSYAQPASDEYRVLVDRALSELELQHWDEARVLFAQAHALSPSAQTLRALGTTAFELRLYARALAELEAARVHPERPLDGAQRAHVEQLIAQARAFVAEVVLEGVTEHSSVAVDGATIAPAADGTIVLDPGEHELTVTLEDGSVIRRNVSAIGGTRSRIHVASASPPSPAPTAAESSPLVAPPSERAVDASSVQGVRRRRGRWALGLLGGAVAAGAGATWLAVATAKQHDEFEACRPDCADSVRERGQRLQLATNVTIGVSAALAVSALSVWLAMPRSPRLSVSATGQHVGAALLFDM